MLEDRLGGLTVVDLRDQATPAADEGLHHDRIAERLGRDQRGLRCECYARAWRRHPVADEAHGGQELVPADIRDLERIHGRDAPDAEDPERVERAAVLDASLQHDVDAEVRLPLELEDDLSVWGDLP